MTGDKREYIQHWLFRANEDISVIENLFRSNPKKFSSSICFHAQQAVEKFLKVYLISSEIKYYRDIALEMKFLVESKIKF